MNSPRFYYYSRKLSIAAVKIGQMISLECLTEENTTTKSTKWDTTYLWAIDTVCTTELAVIPQHMKCKKEIQRFKRNRKDFKDLLINKKLWKKQKRA